MNEQQLQEAFIQFLAAKSGARNQKDLERYIQSIGQEGMEKAKQEFIQYIQKQQQQQTQKAAHGAKLQYFRKLKNQCPEGYELQYFKRGGSVDCGCIKKGSTGTVVPQDSKTKTKTESVVDKFKRKIREIKNKVTGKSTNKQSTNKEPQKNQYGEYTDKNGNMIITKKGMDARQKELDNNETTEKEIRQEKCGGKTKKVKKNACGSKMTPVKKDKCGSKVMQDKCGAKVEKEKCGNKVVAKFKNRKK